MTDTREAQSISGVPRGQDGEDGIHYAVGRDYHRPSGSSWKVAGTVSRITVTCDLPGLHFMMEHVRVFDGETVIFEAPLHSLEGIAYLAPSASQCKRMEGDNDQSPAPDMLAALRLHKAWSRSEDKGPDYGGLSRDTQPDGEAIWRRWWEGNLDLCDRAQKATDAAIAKAELQMLTPPSRRPDQ
ncbi:MULTISPECIES: hypothetical protein [unclassified Aurantimonas]|uniref:hypothetical protein n=1 Tax=unclassified Aurantimonas TaxID=2638230 RepID=UPI002E19F9A2|nr:MULTISPECIES: hypothetical protein [unclassified Aurantimonas]MEC5412644.1 hypothetical protein [Aurantimonas sp. C2-4-R8]